MEAVGHLLNELYGPQLRAMGGRKGVKKDDIGLEFCLDQGLNLLAGITNSQGGAEVGGFSILFG